MADVLMRRLQKELESGIYAPQFTEIGMNGTYLTEEGIENAKRVNKTTQIDFLRELA